jgi:hypothetical protein
MSQFVRKGHPKKRSIEKIAVATSPKSESGFSVVAFTALFVFFIGQFEQRKKQSDGDRNRERVL